MTGLVMAGVLLALIRVAPAVREMGAWLALALACEAAGFLWSLALPPGEPVAVFVGGAAHAVVPALILFGLRGPGPDRLSSGLAILVVAVTLIWLGAGMTANVPIEQVMGPVHAARGLLFLGCALVAHRTLGRAASLSVALCLLSGALAFGSTAALMLAPGWIDTGMLRDMEQALVFGLVPAALWAGWRTCGAAAAPDDGGDGDAAAAMAVVDHGVLRLDPDGRIAWANRCARQMLGGPETADLTGHAWTDLFPALAAHPAPLEQIPQRVPSEPGTRSPGLGVLAQALDGRVVPVEVLRPGGTGLAGAMILVHGQRSAAPTPVARLSMQIDRQLETGEPLDAITRTVCAGVADIERAALVWVATGDWTDSLTLVAAGGPKAGLLADTLGAPLASDLARLAEPALGQGRPRFVAAPLPGAPTAESGGDSAATGLFPIVSGDRTVGLMVVHGGAAGLSDNRLARCDIVARRLGTAIRLSQQTGFLRLQAAAMSVAANAIFITDRDGKIVWVNQAFTRLSGFSAQELEGRTPHILFSGQQDTTVYEDLWATIQRDNVWRGELVERRKDGGLYTVQQTVTPLRGPDDGAQYFVAVHEDISDRKRAEERIRYLSNYDTLTRLPNRTLFRDRLNQAVQHARWANSRVSVLFLDLTQFSRVNDTLGHDLGDQILMTVGSRINAAVAGEVDVVARMGGDEFALIQVGHQGTDAAVGLARRLGRIIETPVEIGEHSVSLRATIGIAMYPDDGANPDNLIKNADLAMHRANSIEGQSYCFFSTDMNNDAQIRLGLERDLRRALERDEMINHYQPQYDVNGTLVGMEALVRWNHPTRGLVSPGSFIPTAEDAGLIGPLSEAVLHNAARDIVRWRTLGLPQVPVAINISAVQFRDADLVDRIRAVLDAHGLTPEAIDLELTESVLMGSHAGSVAFLDQLAAEGFRIAIDDFGTGYSSLGYLKRFPVHKLKIDQSFVQHLQEDTNDAILVRAIINLGHSLGLVVVAEGVETEDQFAYLCREGVDIVQGYLFSRPVPPDELETLLRVEAGMVAGPPGGTRVTAQP
ncbi:sensor domain-containing protein [Roseospira navarrensis]|uniref:EAL domain-containing protein n=1 Tax=Roseospira navarrensis TaxID=140058 RepID=A0A7X1ZIN2_9PROT|nr:EAL domain-containing protein [Roseospira navarrensis]MQX37935.1 EAL domain-containing protein [Roseospira navarrensis]